MIDATDPLTGVARREAMPDFVASHPGPIALLALDIDHFKSVNDGFGHPRGDAVLVEVARRVEGAIRDSDRLFRWGGDELVVVLPGGGAAHAEGVGQRLLRSMRSAPFAGEPPLALTVSVGAACRPADGDDPDMLFAAADRRLLAAKRSGRDRLMVDDTLRAPDDDDGGRMVERDAALDVVRRAIFECGDDRGGLRNSALRVDGPRGAGFTRFLAAVQHAAVTAGHRVLALPTGPGLRHRLHGAVTEARLVGDDVPARRTPEAVHTWAATGRPLVLLVDDVHRLDSGSRALVDALVRGDGDAPLLLVYGTPSGPDAALPAVRERARVELLPLSPGGVRQWVRQHLRTEVETETIDQLHRRTAGLPAALGRAVEGLRDTGALTWNGGGWDLTELVAADPTTRPELPPLPGPFVGHADTIAEAKAALRTGRLVTLAGPGGVGKTRMALQIAHELRSTYRGRVAYAALSERPLDEPAPFAVAEALDVEIGPEAPLRSLVDQLASWPGLVVLDGADLAPEALSLVREVLGRGEGGARFLVTSREPLRIPGESSLRVSGLDEAAAVALFRRRAQLELDVDDDRLADLCARLGRLPLAIELTAAWVSLAGVGALDAALPDDAGLDGVLAYFWEQLSESERVAVGTLAVFSGGFDDVAAATVAGASHFLLSGLLDRAFLVRGDDGRFRLHALLLADVRRRLDPATDADARARHACYYATRLERCRADFGVRREALADVQADLGNALQAWRWAMESREWSMLREMLPPLEEYFEARAHVGVGAQLFRTSAERTTGDDVLRASLLGAQARMLHRASQLQEAQTVATEAVALLRPHGPSRRLADVLNRLGAAHHSAGERPPARLHYLEALEIYRGLDDQEGATSILGNLGRLAEEDGDYDSAALYTTACLDYARQSRDRRAIAIYLNSLGVVRFDQGRRDEAKACFDEALGLCRAIGFPVLEAYLLAGLAEVMVEEGEHGVAAEHARAAIEAATTGKNSMMVMYAHTTLARAVYPAGADHAAYALRAAYDAGSVPTMLRAAAVVAERWLRDGERERARPVLAYVAQHPQVTGNQREWVAEMLAEVGGEAVVVDEHLERLAERVLAELDR